VSVASRPLQQPDEVVAQRWSSLRSG
jgi:hypothetical protein